MTLRPILLLPMLLVFGMTLSGCPASQSASAYSRSQARQLQNVQYGTVQNVREVLIEGTKSAAGPATGAIVGGIAGSQIGSGSGSNIAATLGALAGAYAGAATEEGVTRQRGLEIVVTMDDGRSIAVVQAADEPFFPGERVRLLVGADGTSRITH